MAVIDLRDNANDITENPLELDNDGVGRNIRIVALTPKQMVHTKALHSVEDHELTAESPF